MQRPAVEESDSKHEEKSETPQWMKDAERKRRRVSDLYLGESKWSKFYIKQLSW